MRRILDRIVTNAHRSISPATACGRRRSRHRSQRIDHRSATCQKSRTQGLPDKGRHHLGRRATIISESAGDFVGICRGHPNRSTNWKKQKAEGFWTARRWFFREWAAKGPPGGAGSISVTGRSEKIEPVEAGAVNLFCFLIFWPRRKLGK